MIEYKTEYMFNLKFDGEYCDVNCDGLKLRGYEDTYPNTSMYVKCIPFHEYKYSPINVDGVLKFKRCKECIKRYNGVD